jgi:hypothetical protein
MRNTDRRLTDGERSLARTVFAEHVHYDAVTIRRRPFALVQPAGVFMAPMGHIHVHPKSRKWRDDYSIAEPALQALFLHELTHVWQAQKMGRFYLLLMRHPFCRYRYVVEAGRKFEAYGLEQQAQIVEHLHLLRSGYGFSGAPPRDQLETILRFSSLGRP